jgi:hypothetical protein
MGDDQTLAFRATLMTEMGDDTMITVSVNHAESEVATGPYQSKPTIGVFDGVAGTGELINVLDVAPGETRTAIASDGSDFGSDADNDGLFGVNDPDGEFSDFSVDDYNRAPIFSAISTRMARTSTLREISHLQIPVTPRQRASISVSSTN